MEALKYVTRPFCYFWLPCKAMQGESLLKGSSSPTPTKARNDYEESRAVLTVKDSSEQSDCLEMRRVFDMLDENGDGLVCARDLSQYTKRLGLELSEEDVQGMVKRADRNNDDSIDFNEFIFIYGSLKGEQAESQDVKGQSDDEEKAALREAFLVFDKNMDGVISAQELQQVLVNMGLDEGKSLLRCQRMIQRVDSDGDGQVDFSEFKLMMSSDAFQA